MPKTAPAQKSKDEPSGDDAAEFAAANVEPANHLAVRIDRLSRAIDRQTRDIVGRMFDLTSLEWRCLAALYLHGPQTGLQLAENVYIAASQVSRTVRPLIERGLIASERGSAKRSFGRLLLTPEGIGEYERVRPIMQERNRWLTNAFSRDEARLLYRLIAALRERVDAAPDLRALLEHEEFSKPVDRRRRNARRRKSRAA